MKARRLVIALLGAVALAVGTAAPGNADVDVEVVSVKVSPAKAGKKAKAVVKAIVTQEEYANISFDVTLSGFQARRTFPYAEVSGGKCPSKLIRVSALATVIQCGWKQEGDDAVLNVALEGTFPRSDVRVRIFKGALRAPATSGEYTVTVSSWAFDSVPVDVRIK